MPVTATRFVVHHHKTGRAHYDLRLIQNGLLRCWSLLREPPLKSGEKRLAIERESFAPDAVDCARFDEEAFGVGNVFAWDTGAVEIAQASGTRLLLNFAGGRLAGKYRLNRMRWYPGNRWLLQKE